MKKVIIEETISKNKVTNVPKLIKEVKTRTGKVGTVGKLRDNVFYRIVKNGFIIF